MLVYLWSAFSVKCSGSRTHGRNMELFHFSLDFCYRQILTVQPVVMSDGISPTDSHCGYLELKRHEIDPSSSQKQKSFSSDRILSIDVILFLFLIMEKII